MPSSRPFSVVELGPDEADILVEARRHMFEDMGETNDESLDAADALFRAWLIEHLANGTALGLAAKRDGEWLGAVTVNIQPTAPSLGNPSGKQYYLLGLWVRPSSRRTGVASALVAAAADHARASGVGALLLMASDTGRLVYERLGFETAPSMRLFLDPLP